MLDKSFCLSLEASLHHQTMLGLVSFQCKYAYISPSWAQGYYTIPGWRPGWICLIEVQIYLNLIYPFLAMQSK